MIGTILAAALLWSCASIADTTRPPAAVAGLYTCGDWYAARQGRGEYSLEIQVSWFGGFITAHNIYGNPPEPTMIAAPENDVILWLDTYCHKNPANNLVQAATAYVVAKGGRDAFAPAKSPEKPRPSM